MSDNHTVKIHDKIFKKSIDFEVIDAAIGKIAQRMNKELIEASPIFLSVLNGAFMFSADLFKKLDFPCQISFVKLASYSGTSSTKNIRQLIGIDEDVAGRTVVVIEDIIDSGLTMERILSQLKMVGAADIKIATLLYKPEAFQGSFHIDYIGMEISNDFIVGYGLDYDGQGRNLKDIYKIAE